MDESDLTIKVTIDLKQLIQKEVRALLEQFEEEEEITESLYHVTYSGRLPGISQNGLVPGSARSIGAASYDAHAAKGIFLTEKDGVSFWANRSEDFANNNSDNPYEDGLVPVVLRVSPSGFNDEALIEDELGEHDARSGAYIWPAQIDPEHIEVWDGSSWIDIEDWESIDFSIAFDEEEIEDGNGGPETYLMFKYDSPLVP